MQSSSNSLGVSFNEEKTSPIAVSASLPSFDSRPFLVITFSALARLTRIVSNRAFTSSGSGPVSPSSSSSESSLSCSELESPKSLSFNSSVESIVSVISSSGSGSKNPASRSDIRPSSIWMRS